MLELFRDKSESRRGVAMRAAARLARSPGDAAESLIAAVSSPDPVIRSTAELATARAMPWLGPASGSPTGATIMAAVRRDTKSPDPRSRSSAIVAICQIDPIQPVSIIELVGASREGDALSRAEAMGALGRIGTRPPGDAGETALLRGLTDPDPEVSASAALALFQPILQDPSAMQFNPDEMAGRDNSDSRVSNLRRGLLEDEAVERRRAVIAARSAPSALVTFPFLISALFDADATVRTAAGDSLRALYTAVSALGRSSAATRPSATTTQPSGAAAMQGNRAFPVTQPYRVDLQAGQAPPVAAAPPVATPATRPVPPARTEPPGNVGKAANTASPFGPTSASPAKTAQSPASREPDNRQPVHPKPRSPTPDNPAEMERGRGSQSKGDAETVSEVVVEALIDGNSELHITPTGLYWKHLGGVSKPGLHSRNNLATYLNHTPWMPEWGRPESASAADQSRPYPLKLGKLDFTVETLAVGGDDNDKTPDAIQGIEPRDPVTIVDRGVEQVVIIPHRQFGAKWYRIRIYRRA